MDLHLAEELVEGGDQLVGRKELRQRGEVHDVGIQDADVAVALHKQILELGDLPGLRLFALTSGDTSAAAQCYYLQITKRSERYRLCAQLG